MDSLAQMLGLAPAELTQIIVVGVLLLIGIVALKVVFKLAASIIRIGCGLSIAIIAGLYLLNLLNG